MTCYLGGRGDDDAISTSDIDEILQELDLIEELAPSPSKSAFSDSGKFYKFGTLSPPSAPEYAPSCSSEFGFHSDEEIQKVGGNTGIYMYLHCIYVYYSNCMLVCTALCRKLSVYNRVHLLVRCEWEYILLYRLAM